MATLPVSARSSWLTTGQLYWIVGQAVLYVFVSAFVVIARPDQAALLWNTNIGLKMSLFGLVALVLNFGAFAGICCLANNRTTPAMRKVVSVVAAIILTIVFYLPALFIVVIGPAAIQIQNQLVSG